jgi:hypothetical protein
MSYSGGPSSSQISNWYQQYFGRAPQASEIKDWQGTGKSATEVQQGLANHTLSIQGQASAKSNNGMGWGSYQVGDATKNDSDTIKGYYQKYLGRTAIDEEVTNWLGTNQTLGEIEKGLMDHPTSMSNLQKNNQMPSSMMMQPDNSPEYIPGGSGSSVDMNAAGFKRKKSSARASGLTTKGTSQFKINGQTSQSSGLNIGT